jgi:transposase InsO family protein
MKQRNPTWGCPRIANQITLAFGIPINKDAVRRILARYYGPEPDGGGPSWLSFLGHMKDSLWSVDLLRCESVALRTYWVLVVMDQYTRRIVGFGIQVGIVDGLALCRMFNHAIRGEAVPKYLSSDHDPLYRFQSMASEPESPRCNGNQDGSLCSFVPSVRRAIDWNDSSRVPRPASILDAGGSGSEAVGF